MPAETPSTEKPGGAPARKVLIVDDHPIMRRGVRHALERTLLYSVVGEAASVAAAIELGMLTAPDVIVLDLVLGGRDGPEGVAEIRRALPDAAILVFSMNAEDVFAPLVLKAGANGYLLKSHDFEELYRAIEHVLAGNTYLSPTMRRVIAAGGQNSSDLDQLTGRELQIFMRIGEGKTTAEIADELNLSVKTIFSHRDNLRSKLKARSGADLARRAMVHVLRHGPLPPA